MFNLAYFVLLRTRLKEADTIYCHNVGQVVKLARRRENLKRVLAKVRDWYIMRTFQGFCSFCALKRR